MWQERVRCDTYPGCAMTDMQRMLQASARFREIGGAYSVATVVRVGGSTYRRPGARMLVGPDTGHIGMISGGCLEAEVAVRAGKILERGDAEVASFDMTDEDEITGFGTGCNGTVEVLIEPFPGRQRIDPLEVAGRCHENRRRCVVVHVIGGDNALLGQRLVCWEDGQVEGDCNAVPVTGDEALRELERGRHVIKQSGSLELLFEVMLPPVRVLLLGSGHDVAPVARAAGALGWDVVVIGPKPLASPAKAFPGANAYAFVMHPDQLLQHVSPDARSAAVVMNHNYVRDKALTQALLTSDVPYIGLLGPRDRAARMVDELRSCKGALPAAQERRLFGPVGLDIGAETPEEIAHAIVAEIQAVMYDRGGGMLRDRTRSIHEPMCDVVVA